jgi:hypothetical protein
MRNSRINVLFINVNSIRFKFCIIASSRLFIIICGENVISFAFNERYNNYKHLDSKITFKTVLKQNEMKILLSTFSMDLFLLFIYLGIDCNLTMSKTY